MYSILLIIALFLIFRTYAKKSKGLSPEKKKKMFTMWVLATAAIGVAVLAFAKGNLIAGAIASMVALVSRAAPLLRYAPLLKSLFFKGASEQKNSSQNNEENPKAVPQVSMDKAQAADILGIDIDASKEQITAAHKRLIQKVHPDKGGSDALAVQINMAKQVLFDSN